MQQSLIKTSYLHSCKHKNIHHTCTKHNSAPLFTLKKNPVHGPWPPGLWRSRKFSVPWLVSICSELGGYLQPPCFSGPIVVGGGFSYGFLGSVSHGAESEAAPPPLHPSIPAARQPVSKTLRFSTSGSRTDLKWGRRGHSPHPSELELGGDAPSNKQTCRGVFRTERAINPV